MTKDFKVGEVVLLTDCFPPTYGKIKDIKTVKEYRIEPTKEYETKSYWGAIYARRIAMGEEFWYQDEELEKLKGR